MKTVKTNYEGNPNIGLFIFCNDKVCLIGAGFRDEQEKEISKALGVPCHKTKILGTNLIGLFIAGNNKGIVVPEQTTNEEFKHLKDICKEHDISVTKINTKLNALGNNMLCNDNGCVVNPEFKPSEKNNISKALCVNVQAGTIAGFENIGSLACVTSNGTLITEDVLPEEQKLVKEKLRCEVIPGSIGNSAYIRSGLVANKQGAVISEDLFGGEVLYIKDAFFI